MMSKQIHILSEFFFRQNHLSIELPWFLPTRNPNQWNSQRHDMENTNDETLSPEKSTLSGNAQAIRFRMKTTRVGKAMDPIGLVLLPALPIAPWLWCPSGVKGGPSRGEQSLIINFRWSPWSGYLYIHKWYVMIVRWEELRHEKKV